MFKYDELSETSKRAIIECVFEMKAPFVIFDGDKIVYGNECWLEQASNLLEQSVSGTSVEEILFQEAKQATAGTMPDSECRKMAQDFSAAILSGRDYEFRSLTGRLMRGHYRDHKNGLISGIEFDITEIEAKRSEARKVRKLMQATLDGLGHGVLLYDLEGNVIYTNKDVVRIASSMGMKLWEGMSHMDLRNQLPVGLKEILSRDREDLSPFEIVQKAENGHSYMLENHKLDGIGYLVTAVDVTDLQSALECARKADVAKSDFLANMSHEIRTPMNGVLGMTQVLEGTEMSEDQERCVNVIKSSANALLTIINDILDYSKLEADKYELFTETFDLSTAVRGVIDIMRPISAEKGIELIFDDRFVLDEFVVGDVGKITQIILNLLSNAVKFTHEGYVKITAATQKLSATQCKLILTVKDTGIGIAAESLGRIFKSFEQSDNSMTRNFGGTGLGLAISKKLTDLMDGHITVDSILGKGTQFSVSITLPVSTEQPEREAPNYIDFKGAPILVVDDNAETRDIIDAQLAPLNVRLHHVKSAEYALECIEVASARNLQIPLVICDDQLAKSTGLDFLKALRGGAHSPDTRVVLLSAGDSISQKPECLLYGVKYIIDKPCLAEALSHAVSAELAEHYSKMSITQKETVIVLAKKTETAPAPFPVKDERPYILVADDDDLNRNVIEMFLDKLGYRYHIVDNGLEAIKAATDERFDAVLMDVSMPVLDGVEAMKKIRTREARDGFAPIPILAVTAHALKGDREKYLENGFDDYIPKPIQLDDLESSLVRALKDEQKMVFAL